MARIFQNLIDSTILHIKNISENPSTPLNLSLLDDFKLIVNELGSGTRKDIAYQLSILLPSLQQDPTPAIEVLKKLLEPCSFSEIQIINPDIDYTAGLAIEATPYNDLIIAILEKATYSSADAENVASSQGILLALVRLWLQTPNVKIASQAEDLLFDLLKADKQPPRVFQDDLSVKNSYLGAVWRRLFSDRDIYETLFTSCTLERDNCRKLIYSKQVSLAQGRLLSWLPRVADLKWNSLLDSHHHEIEGRFQGDRCYGGILRFAATRMVDKDDVLMHMLLLDFCCDLLKIRPRDDMITTPVELLASWGLHDEAFRNYLSKVGAGSPMDVLIYQASARYVAAFAEFHASSFLSDESIYRLPVLRHICKVFLKKESNMEADLHVLASLPRTVLIDSIDLYEKLESPIAALLNMTFEENMLGTMSKIIRGNEINVDGNGDDDYSLLSGGQSRKRWLNDAAAARTIYFVIASDPSFWTRIVQSAGALTLDKAAIAAILLIRSIAAASWPTPTNENLHARTPSQVSLTPLPHNIRNLHNPSGAEVLCYTPAHTYLLSPYIQYDHRRNGVDSAEYRVGMAKYETLKVWLERLKEVAAREVKDNDDTDREVATARSRKRQLDETIRAAGRAVGAGPFAAVTGGGEARAG